MVTHPPFKPSLTSKYLKFHFQQLDKSEAKSCFSSDFLPFYGYFSLFHPKIQTKPYCHFSTETGFQLTTDRMNWADHSHTPTFVFPFLSFSDKLKKLNFVRIAQTNPIKD